MIVGYSSGGTDVSFTSLFISIFLAYGVVAVVAVTSEAEYGCVPGVAVVGGEVYISGVHHHHRIIRVWRSEVYNFIFFCMPARTEGAAYSVIGGVILCRWRRTILVAEA